MKINKVIIENFKGQSKIQELTGMDFFIGHNGVGKSTIQEAIILANLGYLPRTDKKANNIFETYSSSSDQFMVGLELENFKCSRTFKNKNNKVSETIGISPSLKEKNATQKKERIEKELGTIPMFINFQEFVSMSDTDRRNFIYEVAGITGEWNKEKVKEYLLNKIGDNSELKDILNEVLKEYVDFFSAEDGINAMLDFIKQKESFYKSETSKHLAAAQKLSEIKNELSITDKGLVEDNTRLKELRSKLILLEKKISSNEEKTKLFNKNKDIKFNITKEINVLKSNLIDISNIEKDINILKKKDFDSKIEILNDTISKIEIEINSLRKTFNSTIANGQRIKGQIDNYNKTINIIKKQQGHCAINPSISCNKDFSEFLSHCNKEVKNLLLERNKLINQYRNINQEIKFKENEQKKLYLDKENITNNKFDNQSKINDYQNLINENLNIKENIRNKERILNQLNSQTNESIISIEMLFVEQKGIVQQIAELEEIISQKEKAKRDLINLKATLSEKENYKTLFENYKKLHMLLGTKGLQGELVKNSLSPLEKTITENLSLMGLNVEFKFKCINKNNKEILHFGWLKDSSFVNFKALSTAQQLITSTAIIVSLIDIVNPNLKMLLIDNIENLDCENLNQFINALSKINHKLDNIILSGVIDEKNISSQFKIWDLDKLSYDQKNNKDLDEVI